MTLFQAVIMGIVEGLTEFLPISSTAHLLITAKLLGIAQTPFVGLFEVVIQAGAIAAIIVLYTKYVLSKPKLIPLIVISFIPTAIIGIVAKDFVKGVLFDSIGAIGMTLVVIGVVFLLVELLIRKKILKLHLTITDITYQHAVLIGIAQGLAVFPGVSRAGAVMIGMMVFGYERKDAAMYSFLLAVPTIFAASGYDLLTTSLDGYGSSEYGLLLLGSAVSFAVALICVKAFVEFLQKKDLTMFGWYRLAVGMMVYFFL
jgi:undecaprenyl-diphosphatase